MTRNLYALPIMAGVLFAGCVHVPTGPNVMVLPGTGKNFDQFVADDAACRQWASYQTGITTSEASADTAATGAVVGTALGAASGAALGAASGDPGTGAAVGAGAGLLGGTLVGAGSAEGARWEVQRRYDTAYMQCMYAKGNQIPIPRGAQPTQMWQPTPPPPPRDVPRDIPPPPPGAPPPPPRGPSR
jgi:hypothetical protein